MKEGSADGRREDEMQTTRPFARVRDTKRTQLSDLKIHLL